MPGGRSCCVSKVEGRLARRGRGGGIAGRGWTHHRGGGSRRRVCTGEKVECVFMSLRGEGVMCSHKGRGCERSVDRRTGHGQWRGDRTGCGGRLLNSL